MVVDETNNIGPCKMGRCKYLGNSDEDKYFRNSMFCGVLLVSSTEWSNEGQTVHKVSGCACITKTSQYWHQGVLIVLEPCYRQVSLLSLLCCSGSSELCEISNTRSDFGRQLHDRAALEVTEEEKDARKCVF